MAPEIPTFSSTLDFSVPSAYKPCQTSYTIFGDLKSGVRPLICLHGGPGVPHNYLLPIKQIVALHGIPVIMYDQLGCGKSTHLPEKAGDGEFWTPQLFLDELDNVIEKLLGGGEYDLLGQSWGGMLAATHAIRNPPGLHRLIIADSPASMKTWVKVCNELREGLPKDVQETLTKHEKDGTTSSPEYEAAVQVFYEKHLCRVLPFPQDLVDSFAQLQEDSTVYNTMNGPSEFFVSGTLKTWTIESEIHKINVETLLVNGKYDEAQDEVMEPFFKGIGKVKWVRFAESSHMPHMEEEKEFLKVLGDFLLA